MVTPQDFIHKLEPPCTAQKTVPPESTVQKLLSYLNGHIIGFHPQTRKFEPPFTVTEDKPPVPGS